jgi:hypothetical protein
MTIAGPSIRAGVCGTDKARPGVATARSFAPALATVCVVLCSMSVAGCARNPPQPEINSARHQVKAAPVRTVARTRRYSEASYSKPLIRRPDATLLAPQPAPDCEFNRTDIRAVDPNEWARLKIEYERQCYQDAEKAARERLSKLQASATCEMEPVRRPKVVHHQSTQR